MAAGRAKAAGSMNDFALAYGVAVIVGVVLLAWWLE
jgi:hypothetical protein